MKLLLVLALVVAVSAAPPQWVKDKLKGKGKTEVKKPEETNKTKDFKPLNGACGVFARQPNEQFIVGGSNARAGAFPFMVQMQYYGSLRCGGSLISDQHVVTAAHCTKGTSAGNWQLVMGDHHRTDDDGNEQVRGVSAITNHKSYSSRTLDNDIAIMKLSSPVNFDSYVAPICIPGDVSFGDGDASYAIGWGATSQGGSIADVLQQVRLPIISTATCRSDPDIDYEPSEITDRMICAGYARGGKDSCQGDSGGPLAVNTNGKWYLAGVVSWGYGCAQDGHPGVYTKTSEFVSWINGNM